MKRQTREKKKTALSESVPPRPTFGPASALPPFTFHLYYSGIPPMSLKSGQEGILGPLFICLFENSKGGLETSGVPLGPTHKEQTESDARAGSGTR